MTILDSATVTVLPEPITIALLALGALMVRRKRQQFYS
ncbi:MAG: PEP-CTERM sorting domain-containing protein [Planctomycetota bacterium]